MVVILAAAIFGGMLLGAWLGFGLLPHYNGGHDVQWLLAVGALAGVTAGLTIAAKAYAEGFYDDLLVEYLGVKRDNNRSEKASSVERQIGLN